MLVIFCIQVKYKYCPNEHTVEQVFVFFFIHKCSNSQSWWGKCTDTWRKHLAPYLTHWNNLCNDIFFISMESNMVLKRPLAQLCPTKLSVGGLCSPHRLAVWAFTIILKHLLFSFPTPFFSLFIPCAGMYSYGFFKNCY